MSNQTKYHVSEKELLSEQEIIKAAKEDLRKFAPLYDRYYERIFRFIYQRLHDKETAFDLTSTVFLKAMENLHKYEYKGVPFASWLYRIALNEANQYFNKNKAARTLNIQDWQVFDIIEEIEENSDERLFQLLVTGISELEEAEVYLIEMRFFEKRHFKEIAEILGITENNAKTKLYRLLEKLKKGIENSKSNNNE